MWRWSHSYVDNLGFDEKLSSVGFVAQKKTHYATCKFAQVGDMWKNHT
ncbi:conserved hypothetical protein [Vibrio nigripulchritudo SFn27]|uniref:Uncharacterized protein n=1 Tax=Vibrio nigripulchritudo TaxID=28173 RepID=U4KCN3_9VIBR|nr:hypothetical protein [Vibrio nigripulchritudo]CCN83342.1 conserved hypothetical protein [Vibrio nigripulchritudo BLFn1]CCN90838.1 conserved hypothetical protein [Vibrio nigripulchritudo SFn27]CCN97418.1 conserved hypothetical protein [Vibrio nigripulchritudo ENn2]CCO38603.1 conserved hypothetical protein [Vibrio nigripulchritudo SFn135]CCO52754.1 conserved hypothetical protein [Vibrio nigripulchritudo Wn13]